MERREFLKSTCSICILGTAGMLVPGLSACSTTKSGVYKARINNNQVSIPLSLFATSNLQQVRPSGWPYNIAVHQREDKSYHALLMKCTHMDYGLTVIGSGFVCNQHGSLFDKEGAIRKGPASQALTQYRTEVKGENLIIYI